MAFLGQQSNLLKPYKIQSLHAIGKRAIFAVQHVMASRKKTIFRPLAGLNQLQRRLRSRTACFIWGALLGNAILAQPIDPMHLLRGTPDKMLSHSTKQWLAHMRNSAVEIGQDFFEKTMLSIPPATSKVLPLSLPIPTITEIRPLSAPAEDSHPPY